MKKTSARSRRMQKDKERVRSVCRVTSDGSGQRRDENGSERARRRKIVK